MQYQGITLKELYDEIFFIYYLGIEAKAVLSFITGSPLLPN